jgi:hypothetical protein
MNCKKFNLISTSGRGLRQGSEGTQAGDSGRVQRGLKQGTQAGFRGDSSRVQRIKNVFINIILLR